MQYGDHELRELWPQLQRRVPSFFAGLEIKPALLHGDLWSGNAAENEEGPGGPNFSLTQDPPSLLQTQSFFSLVDYMDLTEKFSLLFSYL